MSDTITTVSRPWSALHEFRNDEVLEISGIVATKRGFARVYSTRRGNFCATSIEIIRDGELLARCLDAFYTARYLVTLATRFADECWE